MGIFGTYGAFSGLGKPSIKLEFEDNEALVSFSKRMQEREMEPMEWSEEEDAFVPLVEGIKFLTEEEFYKLIEKEPRFINLQAEAQNYKDNEVVIKLDSNSIGKPAYRFHTPVSEIYCWSDFAHIIRGNSSSQNRTNILPFIKPTLEDPNCVFESDNDRYYVKPFVTEKGEKIIFSFIPTLKSNLNIKTLFVRPKKEIYKQYKKGGGLVYQKFDILVTGTTIDGVGRQTSPFKIVEFRLYADKVNDNISDYQTFDEKKSLGKLPPMKGDRGNAFAIDWTPLTDIYTDEKNFQNRQDKFSEKSVKAIINAVKSGTFNWFAFDPVTLWENPKDGRLYVLSGHSRTEAFRQLSRMKPQPIVDGLTFNFIPAKIFKGTFEDAKILALNSNALSSPETLTERADYYRDQRAALKKSDWKKLKEKALRESNGQLIWDLSFLPANGTALSALKSFKIEGQDSTENFLRLATICQWIGKAFQIYKGLGRWHDQELFRFLMDGGYGSRSGQYFAFSALNERLQKLYEKNVRDEKKINKNGEYTEPFQIAAYKKSDDDLNELDALKKESSKAERELKGKLKDLRFSNAGREDVFRVATPYYNNWVNAQFDWWQSLDRTPKKDTRQKALFGSSLGRTANNALYNNLDILDYRGMQPTYKVLDSYDRFFAPAANKNSLKGFGLDDTKKLIADTCRSHYKECEAIARHLKGDCKIQSAFNLWHWLHHNIRYEYDREGREEVRTPARVWQDRHRGVDCDCLSVFAWCVLKCMGYEPAFELAAFKGKPAFSHIYINLDGIVIDRVWFIFNSRPPLITKRELFKVGMLENLGQLF